MVRNSGNSADKTTLLHKIRNCLGPLQTFLDMVDTSKQDPQLNAFHQTCKEHFNQLKELLKQLEKT